MNNNRPGCLSPFAILASIFTLLLIVGFALFSGSGFFSAGGLNAQAGEILGGVNSHAGIGNDCARCHPAAWSTTTQADLCLACHVDIAKQLSRADSVHSLMLKNQQVSCRACHPDHRGSQAALTDMQSGTFPHDGTGYSLRSHQRRSDGQAFACTDCHGSDITRFDPLVCSTCHEQVDKVFMASHTQAYGSACRGCHDGLETISKRFDHSQVAFKLEGKHAGLACVDCHADEHTPADFKSRAAECSACHSKDDAHKGAFGTDCGSCHKATGWKPATFDHNLSAFKLEGKHVNVECQKCHVNNVFKGTDSACFSCHQKDDEHKGKFGQDCGACHKATGWKPATFDHNLSAFKLDGAHVNVECQKCHINNVFKGTPQECSGCHNDPAFHLGMFSGQSCAQCHKTAGWSPAKYNGPHPIISNEDGGQGVNHGGQGCRSCHTVNLNTATCTQCHDSNHPGG